MDYSAYWNQHAKDVGHRAAVTPLSEEEYRSLYLDLLKQLGPPKVTRMLDYGCGAGLLAPIVEEVWPDADYMGCDISGEMIHYCQTWVHSKESLEMDGYGWQGADEFTFWKVPEDLEFLKTQKFDFLTCHSVFTHLQLPDAVALLRELHRLLIPGGTASISILDEPLGDSNFQGCLERVDYNRRFFEGMLVQAGFSIEKTYRKHQMYFGVRKV